MELGTRNMEQGTRNIRQRTQADPFVKRVVNYIEWRTPLIKNEKSKFKIMASFRDDLNF